MSFRSVAVVRKVLLGRSVLPAVRPTLRAPVNRPMSFVKPMRFYSSVGKEQQKLSNMVSSPEVIQAAKVEPKGSKFKELTKKYGAVGILVYLGVGCVDLGITLGIIQLAGLEKVKTLEKGVLDMVYSTGEKFGIKKKSKVDEHTSADIIVKDENPSFASVFILAYGIHKTVLLPVRLGITAAITPAIVRKIHQLGWNRYLTKIMGRFAPKKP